jgi:hypothetical protein
MITWFDTKQQDKNCIVTIYDSNITLNKHACDMIKNAYTVMLGLDYDNKILYIKPLKKDIATRGHRLRANRKVLSVLHKGSAGRRVPCFYSASA